MAYKKILISLSDTLLSEIKKISAEENMERNHLIEKVLLDYISKRRKGKIESALKQGYKAMGDINCLLAQEGIVADNKQLLAYELKLSESE